MIKYNRSFDPNRIAIPRFEPTSAILQYLMELNTFLDKCSCKQSQDEIEWLEVTQLTIPLTINTLPNLTRLDISYTKIKLLPNLPNIKILTIEECIVDTLPILGKLETLHIEGTVIKKWPKIYAPLLNQLSVVRCGLKSLPDNLGSCVKLTTINVRRNRLRFLPDSISGLPKLTHLIASHNRLRQLPSWLFKSKNLKYIDVSNNKLTKLPPHLESLSLTALDLENNRLSLLEISRFDKVPDLRTSGNLNSLFV